MSEQTILLETTFGMTDDLYQLVLLLNARLTDVNNQPSKNKLPQFLVAVVAKGQLLADRAASSSLLARIFQNERRLIISDYLLRYCL